MGATVRVLVVSMVVLATAAGCATKNAYKSLPRSGDPVVDGRTYIDQGPSKDRVLWQYRTSLASLRRGAYTDAKPMLDDALTRIGSVLANDPSARKSRGYFSEEAKKTFIGEPYERVMAYYYDGLLYWRNGEPDNARAAFRSAAIQDADAETKEYAADYVLLDYLDGFATAKLGGDGSEALKRARAHCRMAVPPDYNVNANVLFFFDYGKGPTKYATGEHNEQLRFLPGSSLAREVRVRVGDQAAHVGPYDDLSFQATTRGGRVMDHILAGKAVFKSTTDAIGNAALVSGLVLSGGRDTQEAALGLAAFGLLSKIISASTTPQADTRSWENLPQYLSFAALQIPPGQQTATVEFLDANRQPLSKLTKTITFEVNPGRDTVLYVSDTSTTPQNL
jgi:hypothetical protein